MDERLNSNFYSLKITFYDYTKELERELTNETENKIKTLFNTNITSKTRIYNSGLKDKLSDIKILIVGAKIRPCNCSVLVKNEIGRDTIIRTYSTDHSYVIERPKYIIMRRGKVKRRVEFLNQEKILMKIDGEVTKRVITVEEDITEDNFLTSLPMD